MKMNIKMKMKIMKTKMKIMKMKMNMNMKMKIKMMMMNRSKKKNNKREKWSFRWNNWQIKIIWRPNRIIKKVENLEEYYFINDFGDKELKFKIFKLRLAHLSNDIDENLFEKIFGHTLIKLADKLINTRNKEENQIIVNNIEKNKEKLYKEDEFSKFVIQPQQRADLRYIINLILDFNETIQLDLV